MCIRVTVDIDHYVKTVVSGKSTEKKTGPLPAIPVRCSRIRLLSCYDLLSGRGDENDAVLLTKRAKLAVFVGGNLPAGLVY